MAPFVDSTLLGSGSSASVTPRLQSVDPGRRRVAPGATDRHPRRWTSAVAPGLLTAAAGADGGSGRPRFRCLALIVRLWRPFGQAGRGLGRLPAVGEEFLVPARSSAAPPRAASPARLPVVDPKLVPLVDHMAVDLAYVYLDVPQPGVSGPAADPPSRPEES